MNATVPEHVILRTADELDVPAIARIYADAVRTGVASFELEPPSEEQMRERLRVTRQKDLPYLVAIVGTAVAGYAYAGPYRPRLAYRYTVEDSVYVAPSMQGRGVGARLLRELIAACAQQGFRQMIAIIGGNALPSIALHRALGFEEVGRLRSVGRKLDQWLDTTLMQRALGPGAASPPDSG